MQVQRNLNAHVDVKNNSTLLSENKLKIIEPITSTRKQNQFPMSHLYTVSHHENYTRGILHTNTASTHNISPIPARFFLARDAPIYARLIATRPIPALIMTICGPQETRPG